MVVGALPGIAATALRSVLIDGHDLGVELARRAALLVRAEPRALGPAERDVDVGAGRLRVDVHDAGLDLAHEALARADVAGEDRRRQAEADAVGPRDRIVDRLEAVERRDRAEDLLAREHGVVAAALEDRGRYEVALAHALAAGQDAAALAPALLDRVEHAAHRLLVDERADLGGVPRRIADRAGLDARQQ